MVKLKNELNLNRISSCLFLEERLPLLPYRTKTKRLVFPLCATCAEKCSESSHCPHNVEDRAIKGVYTTMELTSAIKLGYKVLSVYEIWHFKTQTSNLFQSYITNF